MANYRAITAISKTIEQLLKQARPAEFSTAEIKLVRSADFKDDQTISEGISIYLYRIDASALARNRQPPVDENGDRRLPPLPLDLHYLITAWGSTAEKQHHLLGWCLRTLEDTPTLYAELLNHHHPGSNDVFNSDESVQVVHESLSLADLSGLWEVLKPHHEVSATYVARMVQIESETKLPAHGDVQTRAFNAGTLK